MQTYMNAINIYLRLKLVYDFCEFIGSKCLKRYINKIVGLAEVKNFHLLLLIMQKKDISYST